MPMRITGMNSGLDTESIIAELVKAKSQKKVKMEKSQTKLSYKQEAWKTLNSKIYNLYSKTIDNMAYSTAYKKQKTSVSDESVASVITGGNAVNGVQDLEVTRLARSGYLTGAKLSDNGAYNGKTMLLELDSSIGDEEDVILSVTVGEETRDIKLKGDATIDDVVKQLKEAGVNASFDEKNQRLYVSSKTTGKAADFALTASTESGFKALNALGINDKDSSMAYYNKYAALTATDRDAIIEKEVKRQAEEVKAQIEALNKKIEDYNKKIKEKGDGDTSNLREQLKKAEEEKAAAEERLEDDNAAIKADVENDVDRRIAFAKDVKDSAEGSIYSTYKSEKKIAGENAAITLNGVEYISENNNFEINGLTISAKSEGKATLTTEDDYDAIYGVIKNFIKEYNELINEMDKLYNAKIARGYEPLSDEEKEAMSDKEIEKWEDTLKESALYKDATLSEVSNILKTVMMSGFEVNGKTMYLSDFGINKLGYFSASDNERNAYHIDGDPDDANTMGKSDVLKSMIATDPEAVVSFFTQLSKAMYSELGKRMQSTDYSSYNKVYNDKLMQSEYDSYTKKIAEQEKKITAAEDKYYKQFAAMETALSKLESKSNAIAGLLGGGS